MSARESPHAFLHPGHWKQPKGYANGMAAQGRMVFVAGQVGWNADQKFEAEDFVAQVRQALDNVVAVVREAGGAPEHIVRMTWYILDKREYMVRLPEIGEVYRATMGRHFPVMTMVQVVALIEEEAKVEIEATAVLPE